MFKVIMGLSLALMLGCGNPTNIDVTGRWRVWTHDANENLDTVVLGVYYDLFQVDNTIVGFAYLPKATALIRGVVEENGDMSFSLTSDIYAPSGNHLVLQPDGTYFGRIVCGGFSFGVIKAKRYKDLEKPTVPSESWTMDTDHSVFDRYCAKK